MRALTWNVKGAFPHQSKDEIEGQIEYLSRLDASPDLLL